MSIRSVTWLIKNDKDVENKPESAEVDEKYQRSSSNPCVDDLVTWCNGKDEPNAGLCRRKSPFITRRNIEPISRHGHLAKTAQVKGDSHIVIKG